MTIFSQLMLWKNSFRTTIRVSNNLDSDQARCFVKPYWGLNCLQPLPAAEVLNCSNYFLGGKLKTLAEKDSESLQAGWFTIEQIEAQFVKLRWVAEFRDFLSSFLRAWTWVDLGVGTEAKIKLFHNMVMLHIKLKGMRHAPTCL